MNESTHVMLRLLGEDAGLGAPVEARYDRTRKARGFARIAAKLFALTAPVK